MTAVEDVHPYLALIFSCCPPTEVKDKPFNAGWARPFKLKITTKRDREKKNSRQRNTLPSSFSAIKGWEDQGNSTVLEKNDVR